MPDSADARPPEVPEGLRPANENPWYILMTLYGEQEEEEIDWELHEKNRRAWNAWSGHALNAEEREAAAKSSEIDMSELEAWEDLSEEIKARFAAEYERRNPEAEGIPDLPDPKDPIEMSKTAFSNTAVLEKAVFASRARFNSATFTQGALFISATFTQGARFNSATFTQGALFISATFTQGARFNSATFTQDAWFGSATFTQDAWFDSATFTQDALFNSATFTQDARFNSVTFTQGARFDSATFTQDAWFGSATFTQDAWFDSATFTQVARFNSATFTQGALFISATFTQDAWFGSATFTQDAWFDSATFTQVARFDSATFTQVARFDSATFTQVAWFDSATFTQGALFNSATFSGFAYFTRTRFVGAHGKHCIPYFTDCQFEKPTSFRQALFLDGYPDFSGTVLHDKTSFTARMEPTSDEISEDEDLEGQTYWPEKTKQDPVSARESCATIRHVLTQQGLPEEAHFFFRREMRFAGMASAGRSFTERLPYLLFGGLSDFGYSIQRPLIGLLGLWFLGMAVLWMVFSFPGAASVLTQSDLGTAAALSFSNLFPIFGFGRVFLGDVLTELPRWAQVLCGLQTVFSLPLLFFLGLGLRQRFRLR